jgi:hypothetical protein
MIDTIGEIWEAMREEVAAWMAEVYWDMIGNKLLKNAWQKMRYDWFKGVVEEEGVDGDGNKAADNEAHDDCNNEDDNQAHDDSDYDEE